MTNWKNNEIIRFLGRFYAVFADCTDRIALDEIDKNRRTGDLIRT